MASEHERQAEKAKIQEELRKAGDNIGEAAIALGCSRRTLQNKMRKYGFPPGKAGRRSQMLPYAISRRTKRTIGGALGAAAIIGAGVLGYRHLRKG